MFFVSMYMHMEARGQPLVVILWCLPCTFLAWNSPIKLGWLTREPLGSTCLCLPSDGIIKVNHLVWLVLHEFWWITLKSLTYWTISPVLSVMLLRFIYVDYVHIIPFLRERRIISCKQGWPWTCSVTGWPWTLDLPVSPKWSLLFYGHTIFLFT